MTTLAGACAAPCWERGGGGSGDDNYFTGRARGTSQASRRGGAGAPSQSTTKGKRPHKGSNSQMRFCRKTGLWEKFMVWKNGTILFRQASSQHLAA